jgi:hypothetical protein
MFMRTIFLVLVTIALAGCSGLGSFGSSPDSDTTYIRSNGQPVAKEQIDADLSSCSSTFSSSAETLSCMVAKGYFLVSVKDAATKQAQFAQIAEDKRKQEEARLAEERKKQEALERAARRQAKKKPNPPTQQ